MAAVAPLAVTTSVSQLSWDDAWYFRLAVCVNRSFYAFSLHGIYLCLRPLYRPPVMGLLLLPAGPLHGAERWVVAPYLLACVIFSLAMLVAWITFKIEVPLLAVAAAALAIRLCGPIEAADAPFMVDGILALLVTVALLLPLLEYATPAASPREALVRGVLWGGIAGAGALTKVTFGFFGIVLAPLIVLASLRRAGTTATLYKTAAAVAMCILPAAIYLNSGSQLVKFAWQSSYGDIAQHFDQGLSYGGFLQHTIASAGYTFWLIFACLLFVALVYSRHDPARLALGLAGITIVVAYLLLVAHSVNSEDRFLWPIWLVLPLAAAGAIAPSGPQLLPMTRFSTAPIIALAFLWSLPVVSRLDSQNVREADAVLRFLRADRPIKVEVASGTDQFNLDTLALAQQIDWDVLSQIEIGTLMFGADDGRDLAYQERRLRAADFVLIIWPLPALYPNRFLPQFLAVAQACGRLVTGHPGPSNLLVFDMHTAHDAKCEAAGLSAKG